MQSHLLVQYASFRAPEATPHTLDYVRSSDLEMVSHTKALDDCLAGHGQALRMSSGYTQGACRSSTSLSSDVVVSVIFRDFVTCLAR